MHALNNFGGHSLLLVAFEADPFKAVKYNIVDTCIWYGVGTYSDLFEQWDSIPPEMQKQILANMNRINAIDGWDCKAPTATHRNPDTVIDDEGI